jgi:short-subunit dehydrogenase
MPDWKQKVVLISGGSQGLGLAIARAFGKRKAHVVLWARDSKRLQEAVDSLKGEGISVSSHSVDVLSDEAVQHGIESLLEQFGRLDVLVNAVGQSTRIPLAETSLETYRDFMQLNFETAVRCTMAALPSLEREHGHVVNIGSLSSKTAWPYMAPYTASKFALAGFSQQMRLEGPSSVHTMLVCPGPIRRADAGQRYRSEHTGIPDAASRPGGGAPVKGLDPEMIAQKVVRGCERRTRELILPSWLKGLFCLSQFSPSLGDWILKRVAPKRK